MSGTDNYTSPVDFRVTQNPVPVKKIEDVNYNFQEIYDFIKQVILTFVTYCGIGTYDQAVWPLLATDAGGLLFEGNVNKIYVVSHGTFTAGQYITLRVSGGVLEAFGAQASTLVSQADGFVTGPTTVGSICEVILSRGNNKYLTGLTLGQRYWLSLTVLGGIQTTPPVASGNVEQYLGIAVSTTELATNIMYPIQH